MKSTITQKVEYKNSIYNKDSIQVYREGCTTR